jgi:hypothetical protein
MVLTDRVWKDLPIPKATTIGSEGWMLIRIEKQEIKITTTSVSTVLTRIFVAPRCTAS